MPPCPAPACQWPIQVSGLLLHWQLQLGTDFVGGCFCFCFCFFCLPVMLPSEIPKLPTDPPVRGFPAKVLCLSLFFLPLAIPQFGLLSHISSLRLSSGHSGPVLTLSTDDASCTSLPSPRSLVADASVWANSPLAVEIRRVVYVAVVAFFFTSWLCCPPIF